MKQINLKEWQQKTEELNKDLELRVGSKVVDPWGTMELLFKLIL